MADEIPPDDAFGARWDDFPRHQYETMNEGIVELAHELAAWNVKAQSAGAVPPYEDEVRHLQRLIDYGSERLAAAEGGYYVQDIGRVSIGTIRLFVAGLLFKAHRARQELEQRRREGWPAKVLAALEKQVADTEQLAATWKLPPADILHELTVIPGGQAPPAQEWDVFICHASEDKEDVARPLAERLRQLDLEVWYDDFTLKLGDSLRRSIDRGLALSRFGVVILSDNFFRKEWPQRELDGLTALEVDGRKVILPVWHDVTPEDVREVSPMLADRLAVATRDGLDAVAARIVEAIGLGTETRLTKLRHPAPPAPLTKDAQLLLSAAAAGDGTVLRVALLGGTEVTAGGQNFVEGSDRRSIARWEAAVDELEREGLIEDKAGKGEVYFVTHDGFQVADGLPEQS